MALLRAASYGKAFDPDIDAGPFVDAARELRVLNALRQFAVGMPLTAGACVRHGDGDVTAVGETGCDRWWRRQTDGSVSCFASGLGRFLHPTRHSAATNAPPVAHRYTPPSLPPTDEYERLTPRVVVDRLLSRHEHALALHVCEYLRLTGEAGRDRVRAASCPSVRVAGGMKRVGAARGEVRMKMFSAHLQPRLQPRRCSSTGRAPRSARPLASPTNPCATCCGRASRASRAFRMQTSQVSWASAAIEWAGVAGAEHRHFPSSLWISALTPTAVAAPSTSAPPSTPAAPSAATADSSGRRRLATLLLDFEPRVRDTVPILLKMREGPLALEKARADTRGGGRGLRCEGQGTGS